MNAKKFSIKLVAAAAVAAAAIVLAGCTTAPAAPTTDYPTKDIQLYLGYDTGGSADPIAREYALLLAKELGVGVTVQNRPGGSGAVATTEVLGRKADGYTIAIAPSSQLSVTPLLSSDALSFSGPDDWTTIGGMLIQQNGLMVRADSGWATLDDFIAAAKAKPGELTVGVSSVSGANAMGMASLMDVAGFSVRLVPFEGGAGEAAKALLAGEIDGMNGTLSGQLGFLESGDFISLGHSGTLPYTPAESTPFADEGFPITSLAETTYYAYGPKGIPDDILAIIADATQKVIASDEFKEWMDTNGYSAHASTPEEADAELRQASKDAEEGVKLLQAAGLDLG
jgi:tripartite-type tricarboxylate transporter receptor subunit TctC